jgi:polysaccharide export outer membrane protein
VVFVGMRERRAVIEGSVLRASAYDLAPGETLADLVAAAGGLQAAAALGRISISRIVPAAHRRPGEPQRITLDVTPTTPGVIPPLAIENGDSVVVYELANAERNFVQVNGSVYLPGKFGFAPGMTLSALVQKAGGMMPGTYAGRAHVSRLNPSDRTRRLVTIELPKDSLAPWPNDIPIEDQDEVTIYSALEMRPERTVRISGAVNRPMTVPWREGMTVRDLILEARGLRPGAWLDSAEIARLPQDRTRGQMAETIRFPLDSTYLFDRDSVGRYVGPPGLPFRASGTPEVALQPWDNVLVLLQPDFEYQRTVHIEGEVRFPGNYAVRDRGDRLADLIERAGGLTERAYADGIKFYRLTDSIGRVNIDLPEALSSPRSRHNVLLQPNDSILIPEYQPSVKVVGAVNSPGSVLWQRGKPLSYYIGAAGGMAQNAHGSQASVQQANGETETRRDGFLFFNSDPKPSPGSLVFVPTKPVEEYRDRTAMFAAIASMIASTATIVIALTNQ